MHPLLLVISLVLFHVAHGLMTIPDGVRFAIISETPQLEMFFNSYDLSESFVVGAFVHEFAKEAYLSLHLGGLLDFFSNIPNTTFVLFQRSRETEFSEAMFKFFSRLPRASAIISMQHGFDRVEIPFLEFFVDRGLLDPPIVLHLNHERPWQNYLGLDYTYDTIEELSNAYKKLQVVFRHYYYKPLADSSIYIPVGAPGRSRTFLNQSYIWYDARHKYPLEKREVMCFFRGRLVYNSSITLDTNDERQHLMHLKHREGKLSKCLIEHVSHFSTMKHEDVQIDEFLGELTNTIFVLCPSGNNPETFRLFEALETGAIPVMLRVRDDNTNFLQHELWSGYPAPLLESWSDLDMLLEEYSNPVALDALHTKVITWYDNFWPRVRRYISRQVLASFGDSVPSWLSHAASIMDLRMEPSYVSTTSIDVLGEEMSIGEPGRPSSTNMPFEQMACDPQKQLILERQVEDLQRRVESLENIIAQLQN